MPLLALLLCAVLAAPVAMADESVSAESQGSREKTSPWPAIMERAGMQRTGAALMGGASALVQGTGQFVGRTGSALVEGTGAVVDGTGELVKRSGKLVAQAGDSVQNLLGGALDLVGIRYRRGGKDTENGFDCSGFVGYVFHDRLGLNLPRTAREISQVGEKVQKSDLEPGDLVFFKTMRQAFSHVGIYLGNNQFVHAPKPGSAVRVEDMTQSYWTKRYEGARRIDTGDSE